VEETEEGLPSPQACPEGIKCAEDAGKDPLLTQSSVLSPVQLLRFVTPHLRLGSVLELRAADLRRLGLDGLLLDLDCTLKDHGAAALGAEVIAWAAALRAEGVGLCLLSNGRPAKVRAFAAVLGIPAVPRAFKPLPFGCRVALGRLGLDPRRVALVGDQLFADVLAGRLAGLFTVLVEPTSLEEPWFTRLKRPLERLLLRRMRGAGLGGGPDR
jgi:HAD superfamily phosphatase (TIGR01668 family)